MNIAAPIPARLVALIGIAVVGLAAVLLLRTVVLSGDDSTAPSAPAATKPATATPGTASPAAPSKAEPAVKLLPGLPSRVATALRREKVVVVSLYAGPAAFDRAMAGEALRGAREVGAGFVALDVFDETRARALSTFAGKADPPAVLVVRRPGKVVKTLDGGADSAIVAQAAYNAGSRK